ncbi:unnamed protein product [Oreochromis niloticus]|nr:unnamed protein product [Mustela putorius furo]
MGSTGTGITFTMEALHQYLTFSWPVSFSQHASGVEVYEGEESVLLPCQVPADVSRNSTSAVWDRDGFNKSTVHLRLQKSNNLDERDNVSVQNNLYKHRTSMRVDALQTGDLSLTLKNPTVFDSGNYNCTARWFGQPQRQTQVQLKVKEPPPVWPKVLSVVLGTLIILAAAFAQQPEVVEVPQGEESVLLPFKTTADLPQNVTVVWRLTEPKPMKVHMYESGNNQPVKQDQGYRGRTEMDEDPLRTKDFSLTLKDLRLTDSGVYTCTVNKDGHMLLQKSVTLSVRVSQSEVVEVPKWQKSVLLPFKTTADLPRDVTVEWRDSNNMKVHVYESGNNQPDKQDQGYRGRTEMDKDPLRTKDLSLTLKDLHPTDSGVYTCNIYNTYRAILIQKLVILSVRVNKVEALEVPAGEGSVLLPFKTTADLPQDVTVEWTHNNMKVHVYESGKHQLDKQDQDYRGRTEMDEDPLRNKDFSLTLKDLHLTDSGVYTCNIYNKDGNKLLQKVVTLIIREYEKEMVEVTEGKESVQLPFKTTAVLSRDVTVEWNYEEMKVHVYESGKNQLGKQHQGYIGRTEMKKEPLNTKDLSLTLKYPHLTDSGVYTCTVYNNDGHMLLQKVVTLCVRVEKNTVTQGEESVLLPFKTTADFPQNVTVEWTLTEPKHMKVHVYESGNNQPDKQDQGYRGRTEMDEDPLRNKDLSLTLKDLRLTDSGVYTCTVNKDGHMLLQKSVRLSVRDVGMEMVVTQGLKFVVLPFTIPHDLPSGTTVKWRHNNVTVCRCIHVNVDSQYQDYKGRKEMNKDALKTGDLSLTLKDLHLTDSGVYTCTVYNKDGHMLLQKVVTLSVRDNEVNMVEVTQAKESVLLPFKITADLPVEVTVEWTRSDSKHTKVCVFQKSQSQAEEQDQGYRGRTEMDEDPLRNKDLSLTLKDLHPADSGVYTCTIYNKDGHMLLQKSVTLRVRETLMGAMADMLARLRRRRAPKSEVKGELRNMNQEQERLTAEETV